MNIRLIKKYSSVEVEGLLGDIESRYGGVDRLKQRAARNGCRDPDMVDDFKVLEALQKGAEFYYESVKQEPNVAACLTPKRVEIMNYIHSKNVSSIMDLAEDLNRDYKNVYDDLIALSKSGLINLKKDGRCRKPILIASKIVVEFG